MIPPTFFLCRTARKKQALVKSIIPVDASLKIVFFFPLVPVENWPLIYLRYRYYLPPGLLDTIMLSKLPCFCLPRYFNVHIYPSLPFSITRKNLPETDVGFKLSKHRRSEIWKKKITRNHVRVTSRCPISLSPLQLAMWGCVPWILFVTI